MSTRLGGLLQAHARLVAAAVMLGSSLAVYIPFLPSLDPICRYWDGPPYMYVAKTLYRVPADHPFTAYSLPATYFANHLPLYPLLVRALSVLTLGSYPAALLLATLASAVAVALLFYELLSRWGLVVSPLWTCTLLCFLPPRFLLYHAVGASEPLYLALLLGALLALERERHGLVLWLVGLAALTRFVGVLLVPGLALVYLERRQWRRALATPLALLGVVALFGWYAHVYGDFFAYFNWNLHAAGIVSLRPLDIFRRYAENSANRFHSLELFALLYVGYAVGVAALWRKRRELFWPCLVYLVFCLFITHLDLPRYLAMLAPFVLIAFDPVLSLPACRFALPLLVYLDYVEAWGVLPTKLVSADVYAALLQALAGP